MRKAFEKGTKFKLVKPFGKLEVGTIFIVEGCSYGCVFVHAIIENKESTTIALTFNSLDEFFEPFVENEDGKTAPTITQEHIDELLSSSEIKVETIFDKCTIVTVQLPNGFVIVESSACVSPNNYDFEIGKDICLKKIKDKLWELEGYRLQQSLYERECEN